MKIIAIIPQVQLRFTVTEMMFRGVHNVFEARAYWNSERKYFQNIFKVHFYRDAMKFNK